jgi:hydrogenase maturation protein HypF
MNFALPFVRTEPRLRLRVRGVVQGVGFRPYVYGLAKRLDLDGFVRNDPDGVWIEVEGRAAQAFVDCLAIAPPPLARIESVEVENVSPRGEIGFSIQTSHLGRASTRIGADAAICEACLDDLFNPASRFYRYPLVNCTHCGPRYSLTRALPYDRAQTSMAPFPMCEDCTRDYGDPTNRRFHAEPIACPKCGPRLSHEIGDIAAKIADGGIVALKGLGGFHLVCDATHETTVAELRRRKGRDRKPFAVLVADLGVAERIADLEAAERAWLTHRTRPIVLARGRGVLAPSVAPRLTRVGLMLAYTPLHALVLEALGDAVLVATSANIGGEPLVADNDDAFRRLAGVADLIVTHDRDIVTRSDDSVLRVIDGGPAFLRRSRGFVPEPIELAEDGPCTLAVGADLKNTITLTRGREAFVSQHIGDLDDRQTIRFHEETIRHLCSILEIGPERVVCDLHPNFVSTRLAESLALPLLRVQHHVAHVAAVVAEHRLGPALGVALDGHGYGADGDAWGGELITLNGASWERVGSLAPLPLPGGDRAAREPWRMGLAMLFRSGQLDEAARLFPDTPKAAALARRLAAVLPANAGNQRGKSAAAALDSRFRGNDNMPTTSSLGRLFDAAAALAGVCLEQRYEGQAAMEFEALVGAPRPVAEGWRIDGGRLDLAPLMAMLVRDRVQGRDAAEAFHGTLIAGLAEWIAQAAEARALRDIALGGGCLMNAVLAEGLCAALRARGLRPYLPRALPANDGAISFGQTALAFASADFEKEDATCV